MKTTLLTCALLAALPLAAQRRDVSGGNGSLSCDSRSFNQNRLVTHCEMREQTIGFSGRLSVDSGINGGVTVKGWDRADTLVRAKVEGAAEDELAAKALVSQIFVDASTGMVAARGPQTGRNRNGDSNQNWQVQFEVFVPKRADLSIKAHNGGIGIADVTGRIEFETMNGGVSLTRLGGDVEGKTMNGGLSVTLAGDRWDGTKLDARTINGGVTLTMPERYSANFETGTVNGGLNVDFPMTVRGELGKRLSTVLGSGGPTIHVETTNGGVNVRRAAI
jgi:DUF4097 and DUF4098 domain-containing protein YvlB